MPPRTRTPAHTATEKPPAETAQPAESATDPGGWFRNTGSTDLTVLGGCATAVLAPGRIAPLGRTPTHRDLQPATEGDYLAQQAADEETAARASGEATPSTDETQE